MSELESIKQLISEEMDILKRLEEQKKRLEEFELKGKKTDIEIIEKPKVKKPEKIVRSENPKLPEIEIIELKKPEIKYEKKIINLSNKGRPKKDIVLKGKDYYIANRDKILEQKKGYYAKNKEKRIEYQSQWYNKMKEEVYKSSHNGSLDGYESPKKYTKK